MTLRVLVTNDDGIDAAGLRTLARLAAEGGCEVVVAAPDAEQSGTSAALHAVEDEGRIVVQRRDFAGLTAYAVAASPAFIARLALAGAFGEVPDVVLSGVNRGANAGRAVLHSGTVGAALTAGQGGIRAVAASLDVDDTDPAVDGSGHWATAARIAVDLLPAAAAADPGTVLNVNAPDLPYDRLAGVRRATLARFGQVQMTVVESGEGFVRTSLEATGEEPEPGTDVALLAGGYASVTAIAGLGVLSGVALPGVA
jgi:5'-nucleotidase